VKTTAPPAAAAVHEVNTIAGGSKTPVLPAETTAVHKVGERIGPYEITGQLGQGGMGVVYRARDVRLERDVALKVLPAGLNNDPQTRRRLLREARAASQINHPNVVTIYEVAEYGGTQFIAMEYVDGKTLARAIPMLPEEAIACAIQIAQALVKAHAHGVIHRDLKPGNIVLTRDGLAKVLDFGLAVQTASRPETDQTVTVASTVGSIAGTPAYMSPEQAEGQTTDAQSDIFSFGAVLYEMLSGQRAFRGSTAVAALASVLRDEPVPVSQIVPGIWLTRSIAVRSIQPSMQKLISRHVCSSVDVPIHFSLMSG